MILYLKPQMGKYKLPANLPKTYLTIILAILFFLLGWSAASAQSAANELKVTVNDTNTTAFTEANIVLRKDLNFDEL